MRIGNFNTRNKKKRSFFLYGAIAQLGERLRGTLGSHNQQPYSNNILPFNSINWVQLGHNPKADLVSS